MRAAAIEAGPAAPVPTCPKWTVHRLVTHVARVHSWLLAAIANPSGEGIRPETPPDDWEAVLGWWDAQREDVRDAFAVGPDAPAWLPFQGYARTTASWARRQAHEAAIHRLDAEHAAGDPSVVFDPEFAADGIDELLRTMVPGRTGWNEIHVSGTVLVQASDLARCWTITLAATEEPVVTVAEDIPAGFEPETMITGTADDIYRAVWRRPSAAETHGEHALLEPLASP
ncbi:mycothiol maleylpyruvate isomerase [Amycolatopsis antarctica]|uniref:Mycothiol maleylpyruvate isomerase n=1 Tax=Amycolatopsis antarctica TaxID=1854586 RepID=A0A263DCK4_9PSEU|nr:mycothiol maleylpyruvate isomerase [Amycolatopsis antarctica]